MDSAVHGGHLSGEVTIVKIVIPVRYSAWLCGELGKDLCKQLKDALSPGSEVTRLPRSLLVESDEGAGQLLEATARAVQKMDDAMRARYPVFWHEMGPVWTGTLEAIFPAEPPMPAKTAVA